MAGPSRRHSYDIWKWIVLAAPVLLVPEWTTTYRRAFS